MSIYFKSQVYKFETDQEKKATNRISLFQIIKIKSANTSSSNSMILQIQRHLQPEKIINKNVYYQKWGNTTLIQYEVKFIGESYVNTRWMRKQQINEFIVEQYEAKQAKKRFEKEDEKRRTEMKEKSKKNGQRHLKSQKVRLSRESSHLEQQQNYCQRPTMIRQIASKDFGSFFIKINTPIMKQRNHFTHGDRVQQILSEVHSLYERQPGETSIEERDLADDKRKHRLINEIKLNLGNAEYIKNQEQLRTEVFPKISELKVMEKMRSDRLFVSNLVEVRWRDRSISRVKVHYLAEYEPELRDEYIKNRELISKLWKRYKKKGQSSKSKIIQEEKNKLQESDNYCNQETNSSIQEQKSNANILELAKVASKSIGNDDRQQQIQRNVQVLSKSNEVNISQQINAKPNGDEIEDPKQEMEQIRGRNFSFGRQQSTACDEEQTQNIRKVVKLSQDQPMNVVKSPVTKRIAPLFHPQVYKSTVLNSAIKNMALHSISNPSTSSIPNSPFKSIISNPSTFKITNSSIKAISQTQTPSRPYSVYKLQQKAPAVESKSTQSNLEKYVKEQTTGSYQKLPCHQTSKMQYPQQQRDLLSYFNPSKNNHSNVTSFVSKKPIDSPADKTSKLHSLFKQYIEKETLSEQSQESKRNSDLGRNKSWNQINSKAKNILEERKTIMNVQTYPQLKNNSLTRGRVEQGQILKLSRQAMIFNKPKANENSSTISSSSVQQKPSLSSQYRSSFISTSTSSRASNDILTKPSKVIEIIEIEDD